MDSRTGKLLETCGENALVLKMDAITLYLFSQLKSAVSVKEWNKRLFGSGRANPNNLTVLPSDRSRSQSTYIVYKSATGPDSFPAIFMIVGVCRGGNIDEGCSVRRGKDEYGWHKCEF